jgi:tyrosyl-tRNA synthetase
MDGVPLQTIASASIASGIDIVSFLFESGIMPSKGEARKMIMGGGISINKQKVTDIAFTVDTNSLLANQYVVVQKGKKNHYLVKIAE